MLWRNYNPKLKLESPSAAEANKIQHRRKHTHQSMIYDALLNIELQDPVERFRYKLHRWHLDDPTKHEYHAARILHNTPRWQAECSRWLFSKLKHLVAPRVVSACFGNICNRWCTSRRFQQRVLPCRLCHTENGDCIEHYCRCWVVKDVCARMLKLEGNRHPSLHGFVLASSELFSRATLACQALLVYGTYTTFNRIKHDKGYFSSRAEAYDGLCQAIREGARGHASSTQLLRERLAQA